MARTHLVFALLLSVAGLTGCSGCDSGGGDDDGPACAALGGACTATADCCAPNACDTGLGQCVVPGSCAALGEYCTGTGDCCEGDCFGNECIAGGACLDEGATCSTTAGSTPCCAGTCDAGTCNSGSTTCLDDYEACTAGTADQCCSKICTASNVCGTSFCQQAGETCSTGSDCCSLNCVAGLCRAEECLQVGEACTNESLCCSGTGSCTLTSSGLCEAVPPGVTNFTCKTLGESCSAGADCCSTNCQGGRCAEASSCNAYGDICVVGTDCCSGLCDNSAGVPGRCIDPSGGCVQSGNPCAGASNCCTRLCQDPGSGVTVCALPGGCRMTGEYCDTTDACCNINQTIAESQWVLCAADDNRCDNGGSCNPPGNICGAGDANASQNCCDGKKEVCKADANGIWRCFGGATTACPAGWDANDPACCIPTGTGPGSICQFRDQCCGYAPCVPDADGVLHCTEPTTSCLPAGARCDGAGTPCCSPYGCTDLGAELGLRCADPTPPDGCTPANGACTTPADCCQGFCVGNSCALCLPDGNATCTADAECCNGVCDGGTCTSQCLPAGARCTAGSGTACCAPNTCNDLGLELGFRCADSSGTCGAYATACTTNGQCCSGLCADTDGNTSPDHCALCLPNGSTATCTTDAMCCSGNCDTGTCKAQCVPEGGICTVSGDCCNGNTCEGTNGGLNPGICTAQTSTCALTNESCSTLLCCDTSQVCDADTHLCHDPVATCGNVGQGCAVTADCCPDLGLSCKTLECNVAGDPECDDVGSQLVPTDCGDPDALYPCTCDVASCQTKGEACTTAAPCCTLDPETEQTLTCVGGFCTLPQTCSAASDPCSLVQPCCAGSRSTCTSTVSPFPDCTSTSTADCFCKPAG